MEAVSTGVLDKNREHYSKSKDRAENSYDALGHTIAYVKYENKWWFTIQYVKFTAQLLFKVDLQKVDKHTGGKWVIRDTKRRKDNQLQSLKLPCRIYIQDE